MFHTHQYYQSTTMIFFQKHIYILSSSEYQLFKNLPIRSLPIYPPIIYNQNVEWFIILSLLLTCLRKLSQHFDKMVKPRSNEDESWQSRIVAGDVSSSRVTKQRLDKCSNYVLIHDGVGKALRTANQLCATANSHALSSLFNPSFTCL